jgi:glutamyl-tRNA synthetase
MHIGTARVALFNWLYTRHAGGKFALRIEDTDRSEGRYFAGAAEVIYRELEWLGLGWDTLVESQLDNQPRHAEVAGQLLERGAAYYCYLSPQETERLRAEARKTGRPMKSPYRDGKLVPPPGVKPAVRLKMPGEGMTSFNDLIQGRIEFENRLVEDLVILRSDGTPTYNLSVVVDDHDMGVTHVIRGADHINNTPKQIQIFKSMGWAVPEFGHAPMILEMDGSKMSKRNSGTKVSEYREDGYLPEALLNYLCRLGWSHGNDEIFSIPQAIEWFDIRDVLKSPAKFDHGKLLALNAIYIRNSTDERLLEGLLPFVARKTGRTLSDPEKTRIKKGVPYMKERARTLADMADMAAIYALGADWNFTPELDEKSLKALASPDNRLAEVMRGLKDVEFTRGAINDYFKATAEKLGMKMGDLVAPVRVAVTFSTVSPPLFEAMEIIGRTETLRRMAKALEASA